MIPKPQTLKISEKLWRYLNVRKAPGDTFEDVIWRLIEEGTKDE